jgi:ADP-heptose:LPS heptosyltransferase
VPFSSSRDASGVAESILTDPAPRRVAVLRALHLGDMLCAVPALRALRRALPDATIALIGLPWAATFATRFAAYVDEFIEFPGFHGLPEREVDDARVKQFLQDMRQREFDLAVQLHGSGSFVNECVAMLGARRSAGFFLPGDVVPDPAGFMLWPTSRSEARRLLSLMEHLGAPSSDDSLEFPVDEGDRTSLAAALSATLGASTLGSSAYVCVHPGARLPSRRWPARRFATVADTLSSRGLAVCITGTGEERAITWAVTNEMRTPFIDLTGQLTLGAFAALVSDAALVVANDTGISHVAAAVGTPSVIIASGSDVRRWAPHDAARHRVLWRDVTCRPCMHETCPIGHPCALGVEVDEVVGTAWHLLSSSDARAETVMARVGE